MSFEIMMVIGLQTKILDGQNSFLFSNELCEKRPRMTIEDFGLHSDYYFGLYFVQICNFRQKNVTSGSKALSTGGTGIASGGCLTPWLIVPKGCTSFQGFEGVLLSFIDPRVRKIRDEASSCPGIRKASR